MKGRMVVGLNEARAYEARRDSLESLIVISEPPHIYLEEGGGCLGDGYKSRGGKLFTTIPAHRFFLTRSNVPMLLTLTCYSITCERMLHAMPTSLASMAAQTN
jgi:hypothetical protein